MNEIIKVNYENDRPTVSGRELHEFLEVGTKYTDWFSRMCEYGFSECIDYALVAQKRETNNKKGGPRSFLNTLNFYSFLSKRATFKDYIHI